MKSILKIVLVLFLFPFAANVFSAAWTGSNSEPQKTKKIDGKIFYVITTADELAWFASQVNGGKTTINAVLDNDIIFGSSTTTRSSISWTPIAKDSAHIFQGILDGDGHSVYGIFVSQYPASIISGLVGILGNNGVIQNIKMQGDSIIYRIDGYNARIGGVVAVSSGVVSNVFRKGSTYINNKTTTTQILFKYGGIVGENHGKIVNCENTGVIKVSKQRGRSQLGGIVGSNEGGSVLSSVNKSSIEISHGGSESWDYIGGICGFNTGSVSTCENTGSVQLHHRNDPSAYGAGICAVNRGTIEKSKNRGSITVSNYGGGIVALNTASVLNCANSGTITYSTFDGNTGTANTHVVGGCVAVDSSSSALLKNCISYSKVGPSSAVVGGVVGRNISSAKVINCYYDSDILQGVSPISTIEFPYTQPGTETNVSGMTTANMKKDQFAWQLNTTNGTETNSNVWSRYDSYPIFATSSYKPIYKIVFDDDGAKSNKYSNYTGKLTFPGDPIPATGYVFDGWYKGSTKITSSTIHTMGGTAVAKYIDKSTIKYTIRFYNSDSTTVLSTQTVGYGVTPTYSGSTPTKASTAQYSYTFSKWNPTLAAAYSNANYYATYTSTVRSYTITFNDYNSTKLQSSSLKYGSTPSCSSTPTRASTAEWKYTFKGWSPTIQSVTGAATYKATYDSSKVKYTIAFKNYDGTQLSAASFDYGATPSYSGTPTRASTAKYTYTFKGWNPGLSTVTGAATYTALYDSTIVNYKIDFVDYNGASIQSNTLAYGSTPTKPSNPSRSATAEWTYTFKNWSPTIASVTKAATYKAIYDSTKRSYTIVFVDYDGKQLQSSSELYGSIPSYASTPSRSSTEKWNYTFKGWNPSVASVTGDVSYKAKYDSSKVLYAISMINDNGFFETEYKEYGSTFVIPKGPSKDGYSFVGWYKGDDFFGNVGDVVSITENVSIEAKYLINSYKITFVDFDGKTLKQELYEYGKIPSYGTLLSRQATEAFVYEFIGWSPTISNVTRNAVYTAKYDSTKVKYTVVFMNGVEEFDSQDVEYGASAKYPASTPRKTGFRFVGWNKDFSNVTTDLIVEAMFEEITSSSSMVPGNSSESGNSGEENKESILARPNSHFSVNTISRSIQISGAIVGSRLSLLDMQGRVLKQEYVNSSNFVIRVQHSGSYILRVGNHSLRVVIK